MMHLDGSTFQCASCGKKFKWNPAFQGRSVTCPCGNRFSPSAPQEADHTADEIAIAVSSDESSMRFPNDLPVALPRRIDARVVPPSRRSTLIVAGVDVENCPLLDWVFPLIVLCFGIVARTYQVWGAHTHHAHSYLNVVGVVVIEWFFAMICAGLGQVAGMRLFDIEVDNLASATLKIASVTLLSGGLMFALGHNVAGGSDFTAISIGLPLRWMVDATLIVWFFRLNAWDGWRVVGLAQAMQMLMGSIVITAVGMQNGREILFG